MNDNLSSTAKVYKGIVDYGEAHRKAIEAMTQAMARNDLEAMERYFNEAKYCEQMQREAGIKARKYFLGKAKHD